MGQYKIITDATCDLTPELALSLGVEVIPMEITVGGEVRRYFTEEGGIEPAEFYALLREGKPSYTSQINPVVYNQCFEKYLAAGMDVLYLCFSSGLSGTIQSANLCAAQLCEDYPERKVIVYDTLAASIGEGLLVAGAADMQRGGATLDELRAWLEENKLRSCHWFVVEDLMHLQRGGRLGMGAAVFGTALGIKPLLRVDENGGLVTTAKLRGHKKAMAALVDKLRGGRDAAINPRVIVGHADNPASAEGLAEYLREIMPDAPVDVCPIGPVIGTHTGPGMLALVYFGDNR